MVIQVVVVSIRPEKRDAWLELVRANAAQTRSEVGAESYHIGEDVENPNSFIIVEHWANMDAQYAHFKRPEFADLMASLGDILAGPPEVSIHAVASTMTLDEALETAGVSR